MKKLLMLYIGLISMSYVQSQEVNIGDAVRYSLDDIQGTARFRGMSGAFGALGGDMSAVNINPAGSVIFNNSHTSMSIGVSDIQNDATYFNGISSSSDTRFDFNQFGAAFVFNNYNPNSKWTKFALSFAYDKAADYDNDWVANGVNPNTSIGEYFFEYANGLRLDEISALPDETLSEAYAAIGRIYGFRHQQAFLGYEGYIINPENDTDDNTSYLRNIIGSDFNQRYIYSTRGYNGKAAFNFATSYDNKLFLGVNLNAHFIDYSRSTLLSEGNNNVTSNGVTDVNFQNNLRTYGSGFSFQLGAIAKITEQFRIGLTYDSPTWYRISDETSQSLRSSRIEDGDFFVQNVNPNVINLYEEYRLQTPGKFTGSLAYVFGATGLLSFDYSIKDYRHAQFRPSTDILFSDLNSDINSLLTTANAYRIGGEYRINQVSLRGGYRFEESPYKDGIIVGDLKGYSLGIGYNFGLVNLDFAFSQSKRDINYQLYSVGLTDAAKVSSKISDFVLTLAFNI